MKGSIASVRLLPLQQGGDRPQSWREAWMRRLRILVEWSRGKLPVVVASAVVPVVSCSDDEERSKTTSQAGQGGLTSDASPDTGGGAAGSGGSSGGIGFGGTGGIVINPTGGSGGTRIGPCSYTYTVELPPPGIAAQPGQICAISTEPVASNRAARITLAKAGTDITVVQGHIAVEPMLAGQVVGLPAVSVASANATALASLEVSDVAAEPGGFTFRGTWARPFDFNTSRGAQMTLKVTFDIACDADARDVRTVEALTEVHLCVDGSDLEWVSSGDDCTICRIIAEMAPSPIVPDKVPDGLPFGHAIRLRLVELARVGDTVVLLAENDGGAELEYQWLAGSGELEQLAPDVVAWKVPNGTGPHHVQAAVFGRLGAAVASYSPELAA
jgi:hypothetical protein